MAGQDWRKNKKGFMVNPEGKTAKQVRQEKYAANKAAKVKPLVGAEVGVVEMGVVVSPQLRLLPR